MEEGGLVEYVCTHPCFVDVFPVETMRAPYTAMNKGYDLLTNRDVGKLGSTFYIPLLSLEALRPFVVRSVRADLYHSDVRM